MKRGRNSLTHQLKFKAIVKMKKAWVDKWIKKPSVDDVLEAFADEIRNGEADELFEIIIEEIKRGKGRKA